MLYAKHIAKQKMGLQPTIWSRANHVVRARARTLRPPRRAKLPRFKSACHPLPARRRPPRAPHRPRSAAPPPPPCCNKTPKTPQNPSKPRQILVREPYGVVQSFSKVLSPTLQELGYASLAEIYSELRAQG